MTSPPAVPEGAGKPLQLADFQPRSMLHVPETKVPRSRYPVIDIHTHLSFAAKIENGVGIGEEMKYLVPVEAVLPLMDRKNIRVMVNLTGGVGNGLEETIRKFQRPYPERFVVFTEPWWERTNQPEYSKFQADEIVRAHQAGARGLKVLKTLGLYLREGISKGPLVKIDDPRFDAMWETCGSLGMPVAIHVSDPEAFFLPIDRFNERFEELNNHPDWSFYGGDFPSNRELLEARNRVLARHPKTQFIVLHVGNDAENLPYVAECMDRLPNMYVELGARIGELGRQPRMARKFFEKYQDRILFGTDAVPHGTDTPQQIFVDELYEIYYRFLETEDEYFDYAPAQVPPQGRWRIYGLGLPDGILKKVYYENAARLLRLRI
ncbi:MAG: amidohydrolase [Acidobacteria bacterium 13_1_40CM_4_57_6]|nr:MAG: amidohydrolase [Acidobacteria bacterium 13_1_40CM_4_57_6]